MKTITEIISKYKETNFEWGQVDCCIFAINVLEEYNDKVFPKWRDVLNYKDYKSSVKTLKKLGCTKLDDLPGVILGTVKKDILEVKHGDAVYYINEDGHGILGICNGVRAYFLQYGGGLTARNVQDCLYCWSVK